MNLLLILEQAQRNTMHRRITPPFIEEPACPIQMLEVLRIRLRPPKRQTANFKVRPEMARAEPVRSNVVSWTVRRVRDPVHCVIGVEVVSSVVVCGEEALCFWPERGNRQRSVVQVDSKAVGFIAVLHVPEDVVVNVAEEVDIGLDAPVVIHVCERGVVREEARIPATHLVVGYLVCVLDAVFGEDGSGFFVQRVVDPGWCAPVRGRDLGEGDVRVCGAADGGLEAFGERFVVEEGPGVVKFMVEGCFEVVDGFEEFLEFRVADEGEEGGFYAIGGGVVGGVVIAVDSVERSWGFVDDWWRRVLVLIA